MENMCALMIDAELVWMVGRLCARLFATCILFCICRSKLRLKI